MSGAQDCQRDSLKEERKKERKRLKRKKEELFRILVSCHSNRVTSFLNQFNKSKKEKKPRDEL